MLPESTPLLPPLFPQSSSLSKPFIIIPLPHYPRTLTHLPNIQLFSPTRLHHIPPLLSIFVHTTTVTSPRAASTNCGGSPRTCCFGLPTYLDLLLPPPPRI